MESIRVNLYVWGTGLLSEFLIENQEILDKVTGFVETNPRTSTYKGKEVISATELIRRNPDLIIIASSYYEDIMNHCLDMGIDYNKLISFPFALKKSCGNIKYITDLLGNSFKEELLNCSSAVTGGQTDLLLQDKEYTYDYIRYKTFEECSVIIRNSVPGAIADAGCFQGKFSRYMNYMFPDRVLYLFDTFEGIPKIVQNTGLTMMKNNLLGQYQQTNEEMVMERMVNKERVKIRKGYFPNTTLGLENETFAFVSIDFAEENAMYEAIKFFMPKINCGGMVFLRPYYSKITNVGKLAIERYENNYNVNIRKVPMCDVAGTMILIK